MLEEIKISIKSELKMLTNGIRLAVPCCKEEQGGLAGEFRHTEKSITLVADSPAGRVIDLCGKVESGRIINVAVLENAVYSVVKTVAENFSAVVYGLVQSVHKAIEKVYKHFKRSFERRSCPVSRSARLCYAGGLRL